MILDHTIIIPTLNRRETLISTINTYGACGYFGRILILDSSDELDCSNTAKRISDLLDLYPEYQFTWALIPVGKCSADRAVRDNLWRVTSSFCSVCPDDDLILTPFVQSAIEALQKDTERQYACIVGRGLEVEHFRVARVEFSLHCKYDLFTSVRDNASERICDWMEEPSNIVLGVVRTQSILSAYSIVDLPDFFWPRVFGELFCSTALLCQGKVGHLPILCCIRHKHENQFFENIDRNELESRCRKFNIEEAYEELLTKLNLSMNSRDVLMVRFNSSYPNYFLPPRRLTSILRFIFGYNGYSLVFWLNCLLRRRIVKAPQEKFLGAIK